jgi:ketosteroid isomerase-like protein
MNPKTRIVMSCLPCVFAVFASAPRVHAQVSVPGDSAAAATVVDEYHAALSSGDSLRALALLSADAVILESGGIETKAEYRSHHLAADIAFAKAVKSERTPLVVKVNGNTAWTSSTSLSQGTFNGRAINSSGAESMVLTKRPEGWRIEAIHWSTRTRRPPAT